MAFYQYKALNQTLRQLTVFLHSRRKKGCGNRQRS